jgi:hypothetical protein
MIIAPDDADDVLLFTIAQFVVPRLAIGFIDVGAIEREAAAGGMERPRIEINAKGAGAGKVRLTCRVAMIFHLLIAWGDLLEGKRPLFVPSGDRASALEALRVACSAAEAAVVEAKARPIRSISLGENGYVG